MDRVQREFVIGLDEEQKELFSSHRLDILTDEMGTLLDPYTSDYQLASTACLLKAISHGLAGVGPDNEELNAPVIQDRACTVLLGLLSNEGWTLQEVLNMMSIMLVAVACNLYHWNKDER